MRTPELSYPAIPYFGILPPDLILAPAMGGTRVGHGDGSRVRWVV